MLSPSQYKGGPVIRMAVRTAAGDHGPLQAGECIDGAFGLWHLAVRLEEFRPAHCVSARILLLP